MKNWIIFIIIFILLAFGAFKCYLYVKNTNNKIKELTEQVEYYKNAANPSEEIIDSLYYNIEYRDTIIYNIKQKYIKDVEVIKNMPDSSAVALFNELVWTD